MRVRMLVEMPDGASRNGEPWPAKGVSVDLPTAEAAHLVASGVAEEATDEPEPIAVDAAPEARRGRRKPPPGEGD